MSDPIQRLKGKLACDPELRFTATGRAIATTTLEVEGEGPWGNQPWAMVVIWGRAAESAAQKLHKGEVVTFHGYWKERIWTDRHGNNYRINEFNVN